MTLTDLIVNAIKRVTYRSRGLSPSKLVVEVSPKAYRRLLEEDEVTVSYVQYCEGTIEKIYGVELVQSRNVLGGEFSYRILEKHISGGLER